MKSAVFQASQLAQNAFGLLIINPHGQKESKRISQ